MQPGIVQVYEDVAYGGKVLVRKRSIYTIAAILTSIKSFEILFY